MACIAQDGPLTCSERPRTSALRRRDCTWSSEQRRRQKHFPLQRLQLLRNAIRRELQPRAGYRLVLRLPLQRCDARNDHVVCQWAPQNIAAQAPRYNAVLQHANRYLIAQSDVNHSFRYLLNASPSPRRWRRFCPDGRAVLQLTAKGASGFLELRAWSSRTLRVRCCAWPSCCGKQRWRPRRQHPRRSLR